MSAATIETTLEVAGIELDVELEVEGDYADHGIGAYEYWGMATAPAVTIWEAVVPSGFIAGKA